MHWKHVIDASHPKGACPISICSRSQARVPVNVLEHWQSQCHPAEWTNNNV